MRIEKLCCCFELDKNTCNNNNTFSKIKITSVEASKFEKKRTSLHAEKEKMEIFERTVGREWRVGDDNTVSRKPLSIGRRVGAKLTKRGNAGSWDGNGCRSYNFLVDLYDCRVVGPQ